MFRLIAMLVLLAMPAAAQDLQRLNPRQPLTTTNTDPAPAMQIYVSVDGKAVGPMGADEFARMLGSAEAAATTHVWMPGMAEWALASTVPALQPIIAGIGQTGSGTMAPPADPAAYMLGTWVSDGFKWRIKDVAHSAVIQMTLSPDGRFDGVTLLRESENLGGPIRVSVETGTWTVADAGDGAFALDRKIAFTDVVNGKVLGNGRGTDKLVLTATGPNAVTSAENIGFTRIPDHE